MVKESIDTKWEIIRKRLSVRISEFLEIFGLDNSTEIEEKILSLLGVHRVFYDLNWERSKHQLEKSFNKLPKEIQNEIEMKNEEVYMDYITRKKMVEYFEMSNSTLSRWIRDGLPFIKVKGRRRVYFDKRQVENWLNNQEENTNV